MKERMSTTTTIPEIIQQSISLIGGNLNSSFSNQLSELLHQQGINMDQMWRPAIDLMETDAFLEIHINVPGVSRDSIDVDFFNNCVKITGERIVPTIALRDDVKLHKKEIVYGKFERKVRIPLAVTKKESVSIDLEGGVLKIVIDKSVEDRNKFSLKVGDRTEEGGGDPMK